MDQNESSAAPVSGTKNLVITELTIDAVKRVKVARVTPEGNLVVVGGKNAQGKTSVLDSIAMLLGGGSEVPAEPIQRGKRKASVKAELGAPGEPPEFLVERRFTSAGNTELEIKTLPDRNAVKPPQDALNKMLGRLTGRDSPLAFDPLAFALRWDAPKQDAVLKSVGKLDFSTIDAELSRLEQSRKETKRDRDQSRARLAGMPTFPKAPKEEKAVADITKVLDQIRERNFSRRSASEHVDGQTKVVSAARSEVTKLEAALEAAKERLRREEAALEENTRFCAELGEFEDPSEHEKELSTVEETNAQVRANAARKAESAKADALDREVDALTEQIEDKRSEKQRMIENAKFPVPGLGFDDLGPTLDGLPLDQASTAQKLRLGVAIACAMNPKLRVVLVRNGGNDLDSDGLRTLAQICEEYGVQCWLERVAESPEGCSVFLEDGEVTGGSAAAE